MHRPPLPQEKSLVFILKSLYRFLFDCCRQAD